jgi:hypothetical protein
VANFQAITKDAFAKKSWQRSENFSFTSKDTVCQLGAAELPSAMMKMPIAFLGSNGEYTVAGIQGLENGSNLYVMSDGSWVNSYTPASYRIYPFRFVSSQENEDVFTLCIDTESGLLKDNDSALPFYDNEGNPSADIKEVVETLTALATNMKSTALICKCLSKHNLIIPWELEVDLDDDVKKIGGLFCINEAGLNKLSQKAFLEVRKAGALPIIYCQLLSMRNAQNLRMLWQIRSKAKHLNQQDRLVFDEMDTDGNITFDNL